MTVRTMTLYLTLDTELPDDEIADVAFDALSEGRPWTLIGISLPIEEEPVAPEREDG